MSIDRQDKELASTGIKGLDALLRGGLPRKRIYLIEGDPGVGKTTLSLQFLLSGASAGETVLLVSLAEGPEEMKAVAKSHGWNLEGINIFNLGPTEYGDEEQYSIMQPSEVELSETIKKIAEEIERLKPTRVVIDSLSELRLLAQNSLRFRRQILALKYLFSTQDCTVLLLDDRTSEAKDLTPQSIVHGVIELQKYSPVYGKARRKLQIVKLRGVDFLAGFHDFNIIKGGLEIYPRLTAAAFHRAFKQEQVSAGSAEFDLLLGGGLDRGTSTLLLGPAGCGKSTLTALFAVNAAERGEKGVIFTFDEGAETLLTRSSALNMDLRPHIEKGQIQLEQIDPAAMSPGEFMWRVKQSVEEFGARTIVIDSLTGYLDAMPESQFLTIQMHEMLSYLNQQGVLSFLTLAQHGYLGAGIHGPADISYLADTVILIRYFEASGEIKKALSVAKKRSSKHETAIREFEIGPERISVGHVLREFQGVMTGNPHYTGSNEMMMKPDNGPPRR